MAQHHREPIFRVVRTSPVALPEESGRAHHTTSTGSTVLYDVFRSGSRLVLSGPPLLDQKDELAEADWSVDGRPVEPHLENVHCTQRSWIEPGPGSAVDLEIKINKVSLAAEISDAGTDWFAERRVLLSSFRNTGLDLIVDWASFYVAQHGVNAVLLYDIGSDLYTSRDVLSRLLTVPGLDVVVIVEWPFGNPGDAGLHWDSDHSECGFLEHARQRFLGLAAGVVHHGINELAISADGRTLFDQIAESADAAISYAGRWIDTAATAVVDPPRFSDYCYFDIRRAPAPRRWAIDPRRTPDSAQWLAHSILGRSTKHLDAVTHRRFAALDSAGPTIPTPGATPINPAIHALDRELRAAIGRSDVEVSDRPADRAAHPRETLSRLATLINPRTRIPTGYQRMRFAQDNVLALDYRSSEGIRYAFELRASERGVSVSIAGLDDSSRHSVRKRCDSFGKLVDGNRRLELAWWRHATPIDTTAIDAVAHLQRANTAMSTPSPWAPPRSIPSYWWDHRRNFGDLIGPWIVELLSGRPTHNTIGLPDAGDALVGVGSLITSLQRPGTTIWGSGLIAPLTARSRDRLIGCKPDRILAVRGKHTRDELITQLGWDVPEVYGDPALLIAQLYRPPADSAVGASYSLCPHYLHLKDVASRADTLDGAQLINVERAAENVVNEIATSRTVISTSLHGLIVAQAYGVPWVWLRVDDRQLAGDGFKFEDFFTTLDRDAVAAHTLTREELRTVDFATIAKKATLPRSRFDAKALIDAFPYPVSP